MDMENTEPTTHRRL